MSTDKKALLAVWALAEAKRLRELEAKEAAAGVLVADGRT